MGAQGTVEVDFGAFPGASDASVAVTGQTGIVAGSLVEAWIFPKATTDHSADEHMVETLKVFAGNVVAGTGFTVYALNTSHLTEQEDPEQMLGRFSGTGQNAGPGKMGPGQSRDAHGGQGTRIYGKFTIAWVWN